MKYLLCQNNSPLSIKRCHEEVYVDDHIVKVLCWRCTSEMLPSPEKRPNNIGYPRGWKFMSEFVDKEGNVYHRGVCQTNLFGTLPPTEVVKKERKKVVEKSMNDKILEEVSKRGGKTKSKKTKKGGRR
jgi:hypothetical protein